MKKILITGAGSGLGILAKQFVNANTHLVLLDISESSLKTQFKLDSSVFQIDTYVVDMETLHP